MQYDEFEDEDGEVISCDFEICKDCDAVILNDKIVGYDKPEGSQPHDNGMLK
jgi:hypothetical protein